MQLEEDLRTLRTEVMRSGDNSVQLPVNFKRLIWNAQQMFRCHPHRPGSSGNSDTLTVLLTLRLPPHGCCLTLCPPGYTCTSDDMPAVHDPDGMRCNCTTAVLCQPIIFTAGVSFAVPL